MRLVRDAAARPGRCALIPFVGGRESTGFFDAGTELGGEHVYVSFRAFKEMASIAGWVPEGPSLSELDRRRQVALLGERDARIADLEAQLAAVEVLKAGGFTQARRPGRPKKTEEVAV